MAELLPSRADQVCEAGDVVVLDVAVAGDAEGIQTLWYVAPGAPPRALPLAEARDLAMTLPPDLPGRAVPGLALRLSGGPGVHRVVATVSPSAPPLEPGWLTRALEGQLRGVSVAQVTCTSEGSEP